MTRSMMLDAAGHSDMDGRVAHVRERANWIRRSALEMTFDAGQGHPGGDMSCADILSTLYFDIMRYDPARPDDPGRDRFVMSKGHCTGRSVRRARCGGIFSGGRARHLSAARTRGSTGIPTAPTCLASRPIPARSVTACRSLWGSPSRGRSTPRITACSR